MASPFARLTAVAAMTHDKLMGEDFEFSPMKHAADVNAPTVVDPSRPVASARGLWVDHAARAGAGAFEQPGVKPQRAAHSTTRAYVSIALNALPWQPVRGDQVKRIDTGSRYRVYEVLPGVPGFVRLTLNGI